MTNTVSRIISDEDLSAGIQIESAGKPNAKAKTSSATGLAQFLNGTWLDELREHRPDLINGPPYDDELQLRTDPSLSIELMARFWEDNAKAMGPGWSSGDLYLAHFSGVGVARKLLRADPDEPASHYYSPSAIKANKSILQGKSVGQVRDWAERKMRNARGTNWVARYYRPRPVPVPHNESSDDIRDVQILLKEFGYHEVGDIDGKWGGRTMGAVNAYRNDRHLPPGAIDDELIADMRDAQTDNWKRPISEKRANTTEDEAAKKSVPVKLTLRQRFAAFMAAIGMGFTTLVSWAKDTFETVRDYVHDPIELLLKVPMFVWFAMITSVVVYLWLNSRKAAQAAVQDIRKGVTS